MNNWKTKLERYGNVGIAVHFAIFFTTLFRRHSSSTVEWHPPSPGFGIILRPLPAPLL